MTGRLVTAYRRTGADPPFGDPTAAHGVGMEGYFWRFTDPGSGRVVVVLCGACLDAARRPWALVAVAAHPGGFVRWEVVPDCRLSSDGLGVQAGEALRGDARGVSVRLDGATADVSVEPVVGWPRRAFGALGPAHLVPGLGQYWHPHLLRGRVTGAAELDGRSLSLDGWTAYAEKNWGSVFAGHWWWGQAHFPDGAGPACVAFAGGRLAVGAPTALVVALEDRVLRLSPPLAHVVVATAPGAWRIRAATGRHRVEVEGHADPSAAHLLPVPVTDEHRAVLRSHQHLAGELTVAVRRGRRTVYRGATTVAGLERGVP